MWRMKMNILEMVCYDRVVFNFLVNSSAPRNNVVILRDGRKIALEGCSKFDRADNCIVLAHHIRRILFWLLLFQNLCT